MDIPYWKNAPDYRTSRTLDWLNDACEAKLEADDRDEGVVRYTALMSPTAIVFTFRDVSLPFDWKHLFTQANRAKLRLGKGKHVREFPISLLLTTGLSITDANKVTRHVQPYALLGTKKRLGGRAKASRYERTNITWISCGPVQLAADVSADLVRRVADHFQCSLHISTVGRIDVIFATEFEAKFLSQWLEPATAKSGP